MSSSCWQCHEQVEGALCVGCGALQPPPASPDPFQILGLNRRFHLTDSEIDEVWRARSRQLHPDRHIGAGALQRRLSLQWTALLNDARRVLREPSSRASYLATGSAEPRERGESQLPAEFLERVFDWRMALESPDASVKAQIRAEWERLESELDLLFTAWEEGRGELATVPDLLARQRAMRNLVALL